MMTNDMEGEEMRHMNGKDLEKVSGGTEINPKKIPVLPDEDQVPPDSDEPKIPPQAPAAQCTPWNTTPPQKIPEEWIRGK